MAKTSKAATLAALIAADNAPTVKTPVTVNVKTAAPTVKTAPAVLTVPGFALSFTAGALTATVKTPTSRATTNPWYPVIEWIDGQAPGFLKIERTADGVKSPVAQIKSARNRALDLGVKSAGKLTVASSATEKGVWYLVKR